MPEIYNLIERPEYIEEVAKLTQKEWGQKNLSDAEFNSKVKAKIEKIKSSFRNTNYCKLILLEDKTLIGFISIFPEDCDERKDLSPWYATMYVKEEYRKNGFSVILNNAILAEARRRNISKLFLKTTLNNYYEKFGAIYLDILQSGEKLYYFDTSINRISIIGGSGSGKTTLSNILSKELNLPVFHLDYAHYKENWVERDKNERNKIILSLSNNEKWIIDGNYTQTLKERLQKSDLIIWLDYSTFSLLKGIFKRIIKNFNKEKPEIPGCKERLDFSFVKQTLNHNKKKRPKFLELLTDIPNYKLLIFKKQKDLNKWLKIFTKNEKILENIK